MLSSDEGETSSEEEEDEAEMAKISADIENMLSNKKTTKQEWKNDSSDILISVLSIWKVKTGCDIAVF